MIPPTDIKNALLGGDPPGKPLSLAELGRRLAAHRPGGEPYRKQTIAIYIETPDKQGPDFAAAFLSWRAAERTRRQSLRVRFSGLTVDELLAEQGAIAQLGADPIMALVAIGGLPPRSLIDPSDPAAPAIVLCRAEIARCPCGQHFVRRTPRHRYCAPTCPARPA